MRLALRSLLCALFLSGCVGGGYDRWGVTRTEHGGLAIVAKNCAEEYRVYSVRIFFTDAPGEGGESFREDAKGEKGVFKMPCQMCLLDIVQPADGIEVVLQSEAFLERAVALGSRDGSNTFIRVRVEKPNGKSDGAQLGNLDEISSKTAMGARGGFRDRSEFCADNPV